VRDALVPDSPVFTVARFTVPAGERRIERA
jgi:hypothetical protein